MDGSTDETINLSIKGTAMDLDDGYELEYIVNTLEGLKTLIHKTYLYSEDRTRLNADDKERLKIVLSDYKKGSFDAKIFIQIRDMVVPLLPLINQYGPGIWEMITQVYKYLKVVIDTRKEGKEVSIVNNGDHTITVTGNNNSITVHSAIPDLSKDLAPTIGDITNQIDGNNIKELSLISPNNGFVLDKSDRERFKKKTYTSDDISEYEGKVFSSNSKTHRGEIDTGSGNYPFELNHDLAREDVHEEIYLKHIKFTCRERVEIDPMKEEMTTVKSLIVCDYEIIQ